MYTKEELNYNSLKPIIGDETLFIHYNKHYLGYLEKLNNLLKKNNYNYEYSKEELVNYIDIFNIADRDDILYNLGGVLNHELYFKILGGNGEAKNEILEKINSEYGNFANFKKEFKKKANELVGSGYTFLVLDKNNDLKIINLSNQDTPYSYSYIPIMAIDLWEHAYYLDYLNNRSTYIEAILNIVNYDEVNKLYKKYKRS